MYEAGSVVAGKYRVEHVLGRGGMGVVIAAEHVDLRTRVALKFLSDEWSQHPVVVERFLREARACARLRSEHICRVFDVARLETGIPFIVMELLEGRDLARALKQDGPMDPVTASGYILQACDALVEAHTAGIIHRDLKPANLFLARHPDQRSLVKVLDFGVAKAHDENDTSITRTENVVGSPAYMSPEQLRSAVFADARSDIWSLGIILVELVSGKKPFDGISTIDLALKITGEPPKIPADFSPALAAVAQRCLRKEPGERFQHVSELAAALEPIARGIPMPLVAPQPLAIPPRTLEIMTPTVVESHGGTTLGAASGVITAHRSRARVVYAFGAVLLAVAIGVGAAQLAKGGSSDAPQPVGQPQPPPPPPAPVVMHAEPPPPPAPAPAVVPPDAAVAETPPPPPPVTAKPAVKKPPLHRPKTKEELGASRK